MTDIEKKEVKIAIKDLKYLCKKFKHGPIMFRQTPYGVYSKEEIAARYLMQKGYKISLYFGDSPLYRTVSFRLYE